MKTFSALLPLLAATGLVSGAAINPVTPTTLLSRESDRYNGCRCDYERNKGLQSQYKTMHDNLNNNQERAQQDGAKRNFKYGNVYMSWNRDTRMTKSEFHDAVGVMIDFCGGFGDNSWWSARRQDPSGFAVCISNRPNGCG